VTSLTRIRKNRRTAYAVGILALLFALGAGGRARSSDHSPKDNGKHLGWFKHGKQGNNGNNKDRSCTTTADCDAGQTCRSNGKCYNDKNGNFCSTDADCGAGEVCRENGKCWKNNAGDFCRTDADCAQDEVCRNQKCHKDQTNDHCKVDADCNDDQRCQDGSCQPKPPGTPSTTTTTTPPGTPSTTTTTTPPGTPTTTLPPPREICGDCIDNDGDGLTDFEDPSCCGQRFTMALRRGRIVPRGTASRIRVAGLVSGEAPMNLDPTTQDLFVQIRPKGGTDILCARIPAGSFLHRGRRFGFRAGKPPVESTKGIARLAMKLQRDGKVSFLAQGRRAQVANVPPGDLQVTLGLLSPAGDAGNRCASRMTAFKPAAKGAIAIR
jgi:hypothetical protein